MQATGVNDYQAFAGLPADVFGQLVTISISWNDVQRDKEQRDAEKR